MTKAGALYEFWGRFRLPRYEESSVPTGEDSPKFPYITYQVVTDSFGTNVALTASLWYRSESWVAINAKTEEISNAIGRGGQILHCDDGGIWIRRGQPFAQSMGDDEDRSGSTDNMIKRKLLNITAEFLTAN